MPHVHHVPLCRQLITPQEWERYGGGALGDREEWSSRACGMACLRMVLLAYGRPAPTVTELLKLAVGRGVMTPRGAGHAGLAELGATYGVPGRAEPVAAGDLPERLAAGPMIISVTGQFPEDGRRGGHLVVARGYEASPGTGAGPVILLRDPTRRGRTHDRLPLTRVAASYSGRAITFPSLSPPHPSPPTADQTVTAPPHKRTATT